MAATRTRRSPRSFPTHRKIRAACRSCTRSSAATARRSRGSSPNARTPGRIRSRTGAGARRPISRSCRSIPSAPCWCRWRTRRTMRRRSSTTGAPLATRFGRASTAARTETAGTKERSPLSSRGDARPAVEPAVARGARILAMNGRMLWAWACVVGGEGQLFPPVLRCPPCRTLCPSAIERQRGNGPQTAGSSSSIPARPCRRCAR